MRKSSAVFIIIAIALSLGLLVLFGNVAAEGSDTLTITVKISVCGNGVRESGEGCDGDDFGGNTCATLGFSGGSVTCTPACGVDTTGCTSEAPSLPGGGGGGRDEVEDREPVLELIREGISKLFRRIVELGGGVAAEPSGDSINRIRAKLAQYLDDNADGIITFDDLPRVLRLWLDSWISSYTDASSREKCDVDGDQKCNLRDFSIIMYYTRRI